MEDRHMCAPGNCIRLSSGPWFNYDDPENSKFKLIDIARGLSNTCRFGGQLKQFYSVAEHSVRCAKLALHQYDLPCDVVSAVLLHDASEAFCCDIPRPLKLMLKEYKPIEASVQAAIYKRYGLLEVAEQNMGVIKEIDNRLLKNERNYFFKDDGIKWEGEDEVKNIEETPQPFSPTTAMMAFSTFSKILRLQDQE